MARSRASVNSIVNYRSQRRLVLTCILLGASLVASVAVILSKDKAISTSTESLEKKQQLIDHLRTLSAEKGDLNNTLGDSLESAEEYSQTLYESLEAEKAAKRILAEESNARIAQLQTIDTERLAKLHAEETKNQELTGLVNNFNRELIASRAVIVELQEKIALEQSTNRSLLMELAALEAKQKNERDHAQVVVDAWHRALSRSDELKGKYEAAIKDSANHPELSDSEWGIPEDPDPLNPLVVKSQQMRKDYYLAWCDENAFRAVDLDGTPEDYRESHLNYTSSLEGFLKNLREANGDFIFNPPDNVLMQQSDNESTYLAVVEKYRRLSAEERAKELAATLEQKEKANTLQAERLVDGTNKFAAQAILLQNQVKANTEQKRQLGVLQKNGIKMAAAQKKTDRNLTTVKMKLAEVVTLKEKLEEQLSAERKAEEAARAEKLLMDKKKRAPIVVVAWKKATLRQKNLKERASFEAALKNATKYPELADLQWGVPEKAVGLNAADLAFIKDQARERQRYYEAFSDYQAYRAVDLVGTSAEYREAHDAYTESLRHLAVDGLRRVTHKGKNVYSYDPQRLMAKHVIVENTYKSVLDKYREWEGLIP